MYLEGETIEKIKGKEKLFLSKKYYGFQKQILDNFYARSIFLCYYN